MDPEDYREVITAYQKAASAVVSEHHGYLARFMGNGLLIYLATPTPKRMTPSVRLEPDWPSWRPSADSHRESERLSRAVAAALSSRGSRMRCHALRHA